ncbi:MAG: hypothetical protein AAGD03_24540, partial [Bordetella sp.]|nr:hypothetical protein [Pseudomonadota bacterium]
MRTSIREGREGFAKDAKGTAEFLSSSFAIFARFCVLRVRLSVPVFISMLRSHRLGTDLLGQARL